MFNSPLSVLAPRSCSLRAPLLLIHILFHLDSNLKDENPLIDIFQKNKIRAQQPLGIHHLENLEIKTPTRKMCKKF